MLFIHWFGYFFVFKMAKQLIAYAFICLIVRLCKQKEKQNNSKIVFFWKLVATKSRVVIEKSRNDARALHNPVASFQVSTDRSFFLPSSSLNVVFVVTLVQTFSDATKWLQNYDNKNTVIFSCAVLPMIYVQSKKVIFLNYCTLHCWQMWSDVYIETRCLFNYSRIWLSSACLMHTSVLVSYTYVHLLPMWVTWSHVMRLNAHQLNTPPMTTWQAMYTVIGDKKNYIYYNTTYWMLSQCGKHHAP